MEIKVSYPEFNAGLVECYYTKSSSILCK